MNIVKIISLVFFIVLLNCENETKQQVISSEISNTKKPDTYITVLGIAQDAGYPQINCEKECCQHYFNGEETKKLVSCLGLVDLVNKEKWLFDATPDMVEQLEALKRGHLDNERIIDGVFLTHAHIGHYPGLMYFGLEAMNAKEIPVFTMPRMKHYLESNGPWSQLVSYGNIQLKSLMNDSTVKLNKNLKVTPFLVPHRDEFSETVGYKVEGTNKSALFIPDINKWQDWEKNIIEEVKKVDYAFLDASFFRDGELKRDMSKIPHPFTTETTTLFENEAQETKSKIHFIHFNHTNPTILESNKLKDSISNLGFNFAKEGEVFEL